MPSRTLRNERNAGCGVAHATASQCHATPGPAPGPAIADLHRRDGARRGPPLTVPVPKPLSFNNPVRVSSRFAYVREQASRDVCLSLLRHENSREHLARFKRDAIRRCRPGSLRKDSRTTCLRSMLLPTFGSAQSLRALPRRHQPKPISGLGNCCLRPPRTRTFFRAYH